MKSSEKIEFGDFQTPLRLAREACQLLCSHGLDPGTVVEPTCGLGAFLEAAAECFPRAELRGFDIKPEYVAATRQRMRTAGAEHRAQVREQDFFAHDWDAEFHAAPGALLILGNLPWVTNQTVGTLNGSNLPVKENFQGLRGLAARTGKSNFDISEWMLIRVLEALRGRAATIAMLCKTATARKVLRFGWQNDGRIATAALYQVSAKDHFDAAVDACLLLVKTGQAGPTQAEVFSSLEARTPERLMGLAGQDLVANLATYRRLRHLEGLCPYQWRSGVKHDCASVMELRPEVGGLFRNKLGESVALEPEHLYPLLKCTDLSKGHTIPERQVLITQHRVGDDPAVLARIAPRTWAYLDAHRARFSARRSSIYNDRPAFALFGIGDYAFAPWKVAVSGLHHRIRFVLVPPLAGKPVLFDDTCYYLPFAEEAGARLVVEVLNSPPSLEFLATLMFPDAKRPVTVDLLQRLNLSAMATEAGLGSRWFDLQRADSATRNDIPQMEFMMDPEVCVARPKPLRSIRGTVRKLCQKP